MLKLPDSLRPRLKLPMGELFPTTATALEHLREVKPVKLVSVGDVATAELLRAGVKPDIAVVDYMVMRAPVSEDVKRVIDEYDIEIVRVKNMPGTITPELRRALETEKQAKVVVEGEEDLAVIPAVLSAPLGSVVVYGQPNEGLVVVKVTGEKKREFEQILGTFGRGA